MKQDAFDFGDVVAANDGYWRKFCPQRDAFYDSLEWRTVRKIAKDRARWRCQNSGCNRRGVRGTILHVDHIIPRSVKPELELALHNLQVLCDGCHANKTMLDGTRYGWG